MRAWTKFKIFITSPFRIIRSIFTFMFPQVITMKCKTCGELKDVDKYVYIARNEAIRKQKELEPHLVIECDYCHEKKFELSKRKAPRFRIVSTMKKFFSNVFSTMWNSIILIFGNLLAEIWKLFLRFWQEDVYYYLKTIISFFGICVGSMILGHLLGLETLVAMALTFGFFVVNVIKNIINRRN